jgi:hypothetical protein
LVPNQARYQATLRPDPLGLSAQQFTLEEVHLQPLGSKTLRLSTFVRAIDASSCYTHAGGEAVSPFVWPTPSRRE